MEGIGTIKIPITVEGVKKAFIIHDVLYSPGLQFNVISTKKLCLNPDKTKTKVDIHFSGDLCQIIRRGTDSLIAQADCIKSDLYCLRLQEPVAPTIRTQAYTAKVVQEADLYTWHRRLGHLKETRLRRLLKDSLDITFPMDRMQRCEPCKRGTIVRHNYKGPATRATKPLQRIYMDVGGSVTSTDKKGPKAAYRFWLAIVDDYSRYRWVFLIKHKSDVNQTFRDWKTWAEKEFDCKVGSVRNDNGGEFTSNDLISLQKACGIFPEPTASYNPEQNGVAEKTMDLLMNQVCSIPFDTNLPQHCYGEILRTVCHLMNLSPTSANGDRTPHEVLFKEPPPLKNLRSVGCECWKPVPRTTSLTKLKTRGNKCYLLGYGKGSHLYRVWNADLEKVELVRDLEWEEALFANPEESPIPETIHQPGMLDHNIIQERANSWVPDAFNRLKRRAIELVHAVDIPLLVTHSGEVNEDLRCEIPTLISSPWTANSQP